MAMVKDLRERQDELAVNDIIAAIAGDAAARGAVSRQTSEVRAEDLDKIPPRASFVSSMQTPASKKRSSR